MKRLANVLGASVLLPLLLAGTALGQLPDKVVLSSPANGATGISTTPTLQWNAAANADRYQLEVGDASFTNLAVSQGGITSTSFTVSEAVSKIAALDPGTTYHWRVRGVNDNGNGDWSDDWTFTTEGGLPDKVALSSPSNGATGISSTPTLQWNAASDADTYDLQVGDAGFTNLAVDQSGIATTSFQVSEIVAKVAALDPGTTYSWRVRGVSGSGNGPWSDTWTFTTVSLPDKVTLRTPSDGAPNLSPTPILGWNAAGGADVYQLQVGNPGFTDLAVSQGGIGGIDYQVTSALDPGTTYSWRVRGVNSAGEGPWSDVWTFMVKPLPAKVVLTSPSDGATDISLTPTFNWQSASEATEYRIQVATDLGFSNLAVNQSGISSTSFSVSEAVAKVAALDEGTQYFWRVRGSNKSGNGEWSETWSFTTESQPAPDKVVLSSPADGATDLSTTPTFQWQAAANADTYRIQIGNASFTTLAVNQGGISTTSFTVTEAVAKIAALDPNTTYHWRVNATNGSGTGPWSDSRDFTTGGGSPPAKVVLSSPADGAEDVSTTPTFQWQAASGADTYRLQVATDISYNNLVVNESNIGTTSFTVTEAVAKIAALDGGTDYNWRVRATNSAGNGPWSESSFFTTAVESAPGAVSLDSPGNGATSVSVDPTLSWNAEPIADTYDIQVGTDNTFSSPVVNVVGLTTTSFSPPTLTHGVKYFWRTRASNSNGAGPWSQIWSFTTIAGGPQQVQLSSPSNGQSGVGLGPTLSWDAVSGAASYTVQVSTQSNFSSFVVNKSVGATQETVSGLSSSTTYFWRVRASNAGDVNWSSTWSFSTGSNTPSAVTLISPVNGATNVSVDVALQWSAAQGATSYRVQVATEEQFTNILADTSGVIGTQMTAPGLIHGQATYWRVRGINAQGSGPWSSPLGFITARGGPTQVLVVSPVPGETGVSLEPELVWNSVEGAATYHWQLATDFSFNLSSIVLEDTQYPDTTFQLFDLLPDTTYTWRVRASNAGEQNWSITASFVTGSGLPAEVVLESPLDDAVDVPLTTTLTWTTPQRATSFNLQISLDSLFTQIVSNQQGVSDLMYQTSELSAGTEYFWRVSGVNQDGVGPWSEVRSFTTIDAQAPAKPILVSPVNGAGGVPVNALFTWNTAEGATTYKLEVSTTPTFSSVAIAVVVENAFFQASGLAPNQAYFWRVEARNVGGSTLSDVWGFTTTPSTSTGEDEIPASFALDQNYPNPFNPATTITFDLPSSEHTTLSVYNIRGKEVRRLVDNMLPAGRHDVRFDAMDLPSGVYLYRLTAGEYVSVRKLTLTK